MALLAWLIYWLFGMLKAVSNGESFSGKKTVYSLFITVIVIIISTLTGLSPSVIWESNGDIISEAVARLLETGAFLPLIYIFEKLFEILRAVWQRAWKVFPQ